MKNLCISFAFGCIICISGCKSKKPSLEAEIIKYGNICDMGPEVTIDTTFTNVIGKIQRSAPFYLILVPYSKYTSGGIVGPCDSLPFEFQKDGLTVKISGNILSSPATLNTAKIASIIKLTSIEVVK